MPRRNNRDKRFDPKDYDNSASDRYEGTNSTTSNKPRRKRKDKLDKKIYRENDY